VDWTGGQIADDDSAEDIKKVDLSQVETGCTLLGVLGFRFSPNAGCVRV
jgi:acetamidase/formamidase